MSSSICVIIPSRVDAPRSAALARAVDSVLSQRGITARPIVVANGPDVDSVFCRQLRRAGAQVLRLRQADLRAARLAGRDAVDAPFFCFLDDDDVYLPDALAERTAPLETHGQLEAVVGQGWRIDQGVKNISGRRYAPQLDALAELSVNNWLTSCSAVFRTRSFERSFFADLPAYFEWTFLAYRLCLEKRVRFVTTPGHLIADTPGSLSKSQSYERGQLDMLERVLALKLPSPTRVAVRTQYGQALHDRAEALRLEHALKAAWGAHARSLLQPGGLRFTSYTRHLLAATLCVRASASPRSV